MSPELRFAAQLNRLARVLRLAADRSDELGVGDVVYADGLRADAWTLRYRGRLLIQWAAVKGSEFSTTKPLVDGA